MPYSHLAGHQFPGAVYTLPGYVSFLWSDAARLEPDPDHAHPGLIYFLGLRGAGVSIQGIFDLMDADVDSGVVLGEYSAEVNGLIRSGVAYECTAKILSVERKRGQRAGVFDKLSFQVIIREPERSEPLAVTTNDWIFPRREDAP
jgi:hypothetical protein